MTISTIPLAKSSFQLLVKNQKKYLKKVDKEKNQIDMKKLQNLISKAETQALEGSEYFDFRDSQNPQQMQINTNLNRSGEFNEESKKYFLQASKLS